MHRALMASVLIGAGDPTRLGELRDHSFENQRFRASGLIVLWNIVYLERAVQNLKAHGKAVDDSLLTHLSPLAWKHFNLVGDYAWRQSKQEQTG